MYRSLQYVIFTPCNATVLNVILYCNIGWCIKDGAVQHSRQQWLIACRSQMVRLGVTVRVRVKKKNLPVYQTFHYLQKWVWFMETS